MASENPSAPFFARFGDAHSAARHEVEVRLATGGLEIHYLDTDERLTWPYGDLVSPTPLATGSPDVALRKCFRTPATLFCDDPHFAARLLAHAPHLGRRRWAWRHARPALAIMGVLTALYGLYVYLELSPARAVARVLPETLRSSAGDQLLDGIMRARPACVEADGLQALQALTTRLTRDAPEENLSEVTVLRWPLVNAFALPGGKVILTSGLIQQATGPDEVAGVLAHEIGHVAELHPETSMVRAFGISLVGKLLLAGTSDTLSTVGALLVQLGYSREAEREADTSALARLREARISPKPLAGFFARLVEKSGDEETQRKSSALAKRLSFLSTHPPIPERTERIEGVEPYTWTPALSPGAWRALKGICAQTSAGGGDGGDSQE